ncbi:MAG: glycosyl hydrolase [Pirellulales bacterium]
MSIKHAIPAILLPLLVASVSPAAGGAADGPRQAAGDSEARPSSLPFSDPASVPPAPAWAVGQVSRAPDLDVLPGFRQPPRGFGVVPFYWWLGDPLTKERLGWELEQLADMGICGLQINYAHTDRGGRSYGLTMPSDPPLFSADWWKLVGWFMTEAKKRGIAVSLSDYTLGIGQGWSVDVMLRAHRELTGAQLRLVTGDVPADALTSAEVRGPDGKSQRVAVRAEKAPYSLDPMNPSSGAAYAKSFFGQFEEHFPGEGGKGLDFFFSDEMGFGVGGRLWTARFAEEFKNRKGYDIIPELPALFFDTGPRTPKVRLDYSDVMVSLSEEGFFKPVFDWHQQRGMTMGCDHGGRGRDVLEFGDYFRTQRWNQGPGSDQPGLGKDLIKAKVASSIAHLYQRPRVWLEGYYGSGWGTTPAGVVDATFADFVMGYNLLSFHGLYYSTHGGWWEWAPPCNTYHMPYWQHMRGFLRCVERLSYLLSQGHHRCDVAIVYPVAPMEAGMGGPEAVRAAFDTGSQVYADGIDFDFIDWQSLARAKVVGRELHVSGEVYRVLVLPAMKAVRFSTLEKALAFHRAGGVVLAVGALPEASDRVGRNDPQLAAMVKELFPKGPDSDVAARVPGRDFEISESSATGRTTPAYVTHRKLGARDLYAVYGVSQGTACKFRAAGNVEWWDPWTGQAHPLPVRSQANGVTEAAMPLSEKEIQLIVFTPGAAATQKPEPASRMTTVELSGEWEFELKPMLDNRFGDYHWPPTPTLVGAEARQVEYAEGRRPDGPWRRVTASFGPHFWKLGPVAPVGDEAALKPDARWKACEFSWRWGLERDPGHQGYHGLKGEVHDELIGLGTLRLTATGTAYEKEGDGCYYLWTTVVAPREMTAYAVTGVLKPAGVWLNGAVVKDTALHLKAGANPLLLRYEQVGSTFFVVATTPAPVQAEAFSPAASWIWYPNEKVNSERWFRKSFDLDADPAQARLRITCDNAYEVSINATPIGSGDRWETVQEYDVARALRRGRNEIVIRARNGGGEAGLIAELTAGAARIATDDSWRCAQTENGEAVDAQKVGSFIGSLWYKHPNGPPQLAPPTVEGQPQFTGSPLATRWWNDAAVLPFDTRPDEKTPVGWYRFTAPPGLRAMTVSARGRVQAWVNGTELAAEGGKLVVAKPVATPAPVLLRIEQERGCYGGAALTEPIRLECVPGRMSLGDWSRIDGLLSYSGGASYRKVVTIPRARRVVLDLGDVAASAEVRVNGQAAGTRVSPPWRFDITSLVRAGENRIEVLVCNTLANHYTTVPTRYRGATTSGLLGPVTLQFAE